MYIDTLLDIALRSPTGVAMVAAAFAAHATASILFYLDINMLREKSICEYSWIGLTRLCRRRGQHQLLAQRPLYMIYLACIFLYYEPLLLV